MNNTALAQFWDISGAFDVRSSNDAVLSLSGSSARMLLGALVLPNAANALLPLPSPNPAGTGANYSDGSVMKWAVVQNSPNDYGPWTSATGSEEDLPSPDNVNENTCPCGTMTKTDVRQLSSAGKTPGAGGVAITRILGRRECRYSSVANSGAGGCEYGLTNDGSLNDYDFSISTSGRKFDDGSNSWTADRPPQCNFNYAAFIDKYGKYLSVSGGVDLTVDGAAICAEASLCGSAATCVRERSCVIEDDNDGGSNEYTSGWKALDGGTQPGVARADKNTHGCARTGWPAGTGLECKNAWDERWFTVVTCGIGSGGPKVGAGVRYQKRTLQCNSCSGPTNFGTFLILDK